MRTLNILDCTLRDGGCVNDFNFGQSYMCKILNGLENAGIDIIECGYIDENKGTVVGRTQYCNEQVITEKFITSKKRKIMYVAMIDYGQFNIEKLKPRTENSIDGIRIAFHKKDCYNMISVARKIIDKGYQLYIQPMTTMRYSDKELIDFIEIVNKQLPDATAFYIVDSFGEMRINDMNRVVNLVDHNLLPHITLGFHSHNNLQLSYSNAVTLLMFPTIRNLIFDCSIMGMGKGAGNLNTELFAEHLNLYYGKNYKIVPLLGVIDEVLNQIRSEFYWGYSIEYYLSSINHCTPRYAEHFYKKHMLPVEQVAELLALIDEEKKVSFDKEYSEQLYREYNKKPFDDEKTLKILKAKVQGKKVLLLAPGKSLTTEEAQIRLLLDDENIVSFSLNSYGIFSTEFVLTTKIDAFKGAITQRNNVIVTSNVYRGTAEGVFVVSYEKWISLDGGTQDLAIVIMLNILKACGAKEVMLAGFDGFSVNINENYYDKNLRRPVTVEQANSRNEYIKRFLKDISEVMHIEFITKSLYQ